VQLLLKHSQQVMLTRGQLLHRQASILLELQALLILSTVQMKLKPQHHRLPVFKLQPSSPLMKQKKK
jgi:hypothetical protein